MPIGAVGNPNFCDFTNRNDPPLAQTHRALAKLREIQKSLFRKRFDRGFNSPLNRRARCLEIGEFSIWQTVYFYRNYVTIKEDFKRHGPVVAIWRYGRKSDLPHRSGNTIDFDLNDPRHTGEIFDGLRRDGTLHLHLTGRKFAIRYLVDSRTLVLMARIRSGISKK